MSLTGSRLVLMATKEELARLTQAFLAEPATPTVTEKDREAQCLAFLDRICGTGDEVLGGFLFEIGQGGTGREVVKGDRVVTLYPSANERTNAIRMLRVMHRGLAQRAVKVEHTHEHRHKWDPGKLTLAQLEALETAHAVAALPAGETVDAEFSENPDSPEKPEKLEDPESEE